MSSGDDPKTFILPKDTKNTGLLIFNSLKQKKLIFNFFVNRNWKKKNRSRKRAKILADNLKSHHPIETLCRIYDWNSRRFDLSSTFDSYVAFHMCRA